MKMYQIKTLLLAGLMSSCTGGFKAVTSGTSTQSSTQGSSSASSCYQSTSSTLKLSWIAPTQDSHNNLLTSSNRFISKYLVTYGPSNPPTEFTTTVTSSANGAAPTSVAFQNLTSGQDYYFSVLAYDNTGLVSPQSQSQCAHIN